MFFAFPAQRSKLPGLPRLDPRSAKLLDRMLYDLLAKGCWTLMPRAVEQRFGGGGHVSHLGPRRRNFSLGFQGDTAPKSKMEFLQTSSDTLSNLESMKTRSGAYSMTRFITHVTGPETYGARSISINVFF